MFEGTKNFAENKKTEKEITEQKEDARKKTPKFVPIMDDVEGPIITKQQARFVVNKKGETVDIEEDDAEDKSEKIFSPKEKERTICSKSDAPKKFIVDNKGKTIETELSEEELEQIGKMLGKKYI